MNPIDSRIRPNLPANRSSAAARRSRQRGISMLFVLFVLVLVVIVGGAGLRLLPTFIEYRAITSAIDRAMKEGDTPQSIRTYFDRAAAIDDIHSIAGKDLFIQVSDGKPSVSFDYEKRVPLAGPVSLVVEYRRGETGI